MEKKSRQRILHLIDHLPDYHKNWGGAEKSALRRIQILSQSNDFETIVVATKPQKKVVEQFTFYRIWTMEDLFPKRIQLYITGFKNQILSFDPISFFGLIKLIRKIKPDIVHLHKANKISLAPILICKLLKIPLVLSVSDYWYFCPSADLIDKEGDPCLRFQGKWCANCSATLKFGFLRRFAYRYRRPIMDLFISQVSAFRVSSFASKKLLVRYGIDPLKIVVVRQVSNEDISKMRVKPQKNLIYLNAWMSFHKGVHIAIEAMAKIVKEIPEAKMEIDTKIFDKTYEEKILGMIKDFNLTGKVTLNEKPTQTQYLKNIKKSKVIIVPEQWENMGPTTMGDAMAMGKAIVASRIGGIPEFIKNGKNGFLVNHEDTSGFAKRIIQLLKNDNLAKKMGYRAQKDIAQLSSGETCLKSLRKLYRVAVQHS